MRFNRSSVGVLSDNATLLSWEMSSTTKKLNWNKAKRYCKNLKYGSRDDWKLPTIYQLKSLIDYKKYNPATVTNLINIKISNYYWSSSVDNTDSSLALGILFKDGNDGFRKKIDELHVLCVCED